MFVLQERRAPTRRQGARRCIEIDELIKQHLPQGSTFDYAENVLRSAGFTLPPGRPLTPLECLLAVSTSSM